LVSGFRNGILEADYDLRDAICQRLQQKIAMSDTGLYSHDRAAPILGRAFLSKRH
jgi:hypothetical protein